MSLRFYFIHDDVEIPAKFRRDKPHALGLWTTLTLTLNQQEGRKFQLTHKAIWHSVVRRNGAFRDSRFEKWRGCLISGAADGKIVRHFTLLVPPNIPDRKNRQELLTYHTMWRVRSWTDISDEMHSKGGDGSIQNHIQVPKAYKSATFWSSSSCAKTNQSNPPTIIMSVVAKNAALVALGAAGAVFAVNAVAKPTATQGIANAMRSQLDSFNSHVQPEQNRR